MKTVSQDIQDLSIQSLESTFNKLSKAYKTMSEKGSNTTLVKKRRDAVKIGLDSLREDWNGEGFFYDKENILTSIDTLQGIIPSVDKQIAKAQDGSPQKTLNERRLTALKLSVESLKSRLE